MRTFALFIALAIATSTAIAQLAPTTPAPLAAHLLEVNKEWRTMDPYPAGGDLIVHFDNDAQRIAMHLHRVAAHLRAHSPEGLSASSSEQRTTLLETLDAYADRGLFPRNQVLPYRNPVFIDPHGTACAVGQLMIESGEQRLAEDISHQMNLAYVHDMRRPDVDAWAGAHGFTEDELAWIQPAYTPPTNWYPLGAGTNSRVTALHGLSNGNLLVAGDFTFAGTIYAQQVAAWLGSSYQGFGGGVDGTVNCAVEFGGLLYLGGSFNTGYQDLAVWDGAIWEYENAFNGKWVQVNDLHVFEGELYAAGYAAGFAGLTHQVLKLGSGGWQPVGGALGTEFNDEVLAIDDLGGNLVCAGRFTQLGMFGGPALAHVANVYGSSDWFELGDGLDATVRYLQIFNGVLYAAGELRVDSLPTFGLARIAAGAIIWEQLMPNQVTYTDYFNGEAYINSLAVANGDLYLGGAFSLPGMFFYGANVARFGGVSDLIFVIANTDGKVNKLAPFNDLLVMGGEFQNNDFTTIPFIGYTDLAAGIGDPAVHATFDLLPNPAVDHVVVTLDGSAGGDAIAEVIDAAGRTVIAPQPLTSSATRIDVRALAPGTYLVRVAASGSMSTAPFVKQ